ncbi:MAG: hypothetical protein DRR16_14865 [Candidatus Parabeggiatoa sp. nov. 3]|nr:MAG: hypothetical protein DRR00_00870 [Gammaproteobacteria bacterium]RKZ68329.1 MAG: hypothetical protein DRQ99_04135 [Gammaproteobacteria bacterium]RKZ84385.1 MAG: hypothetical protein DRR16_14865 [Gammaproteobacteria bacterium]HEW97284.1 hypothetical protein [Beggiatoa sp.]
MKVLPSIVRVPKISCSQPQTDFSEAELDEAARLILEMQGVVMPVILRRTAPDSESYTVIDGAFEYYAALRAMEIDSRKGNKINAYIVESEEEEAGYKKQIAMFRQREVQQVVVSPLPEKAASVAMQSEGGDERVDEGVNERVDGVDKGGGEGQRLMVLEQFIKTLLLNNDILEKMMSNFAVEKDNLLHETVIGITVLFNEQMKVFSEQIKQTVNEQFKGLIEQVATLQNASRLTPGASPTSSPVEPPSVSTREAPVVQETDLLPQKPPTQETLIIALSEKEQPFLEELNTLSIDQLGMKFGRLSKVKRKPDLISFLVAEREKQPFTSTDDMKKRAKGKGLLGDKTIKNIVEQWV